MASAAGEGRSRVLVIGGTGYIGRFIVAASAREGHPTAVLVRDAAPADPAKAAVLQGFRDAGVTIVKNLSLSNLLGFLRFFSVQAPICWGQKGDMYDHESLVTAIKSADVVISAVGYQQLPDQTLIISAIKEVGHVKQFLLNSDIDELLAEILPIRPSADWDHGASN
ncbi:unnamed protein product [Triticum turgidum subsp. durum]|uniref:NmrA-like domain-containing protein n=1 Tax=Triticum turgidum subsp. durum TaxID=4567 RepID=A0A9R0ZYN9_TRITD|nr:unnamed protein product [Triticum turgidum subsp. durum]